MNIINSISSSNIIGIALFTTCISSFIQNAAKQEHKDQNIECIKLETLIHSLNTTLSKNKSNFEFAILTTKQNNNIINDLFWLTQQSIKYWNNPEQREKIFDIETYKASSFEERIKMLTTPPTRSKQENSQYIKLNWVNENTTKQNIEKVMLKHWNILRIFYPCLSFLLNEELKARESIENKINKSYSDRVNTIITSDKYEGFILLNNIEQNILFDSLKEESKIISSDLYKIENNFLYNNSFKLPWIFYRSCSIPYSIYRAYNNYQKYNSVLYVLGNFSIDFLIPFGLITDSITFICYDWYKQWIYNSVMQTSKDFVEAVCTGKINTDNYPNTPNTKLFSLAFTLLGTGVWKFYQRPNFKTGIILCSTMGVMYGIGSITGFSFPSVIVFFGQWIHLHFDLGKNDSFWNTVLSNLKKTAIYGTTAVGHIILANVIRNWLQPGNNQAISQIVAE